MSDQPKESAFGLMDDLLSHFNRRKKFFMALVISSFAIAPVTIILAILALSPPFLASAGQPFDVTVAVHEPRHVAGPYPGDEAWVKIVPEGDDSVMILNTSGLKGSGGIQTFALDRSQVTVDYVPAGSFAAGAVEVKQLPPRFLYVTAAPAQPFDVTWVIVLLVVLSAGIAGAWLFAGVKEYRFFSDWNRRYASYEQMQEKVDKELDGSTG